MKQAESELIATRPEEAKRIGNDVLALVKRRVQLKGETATGEQFEKYSQAVVPFWFFNDKNIVASAKEKLSKNYFASYEDFRRANNRQVAHYDATLTGEMMRSLQVEVVKHGKTKTEIEFVPRTSAGKDKLGWQDDRNKRATLEPSKSELALAGKANLKRVEKILFKFDIIE